MKRTIIIVLLSQFLSFTMRAQTLEECQQAAERNYPLIRQYDLIEKTTELTLANIQKGWLPQVSASAQATYQSDVVSFPDQMQALYQQVGIDMKGLTKDQYRVGIDVSQTIYDGGFISSQKAIAREQGKVQAAQNEVNIYNVRRRVNEMYFSLLLIDEQIQLNSDLQELLSGNERKLTSMVKGGTAAESDLNNVKAERLKAVQRTTELESQKRMLQRMLSTFCGIEVKALSKPLRGKNVSLLGEKGEMLRPELRLFDAQLRLADTQEKALDAALKPTLGVFAQGYYGYPGLNMFEDMMSRKWSLNGIIGARLTWNIGALYTRKNDKAKLQLQREVTESNRDVFLFNNNLEQIQQNENIARYQQLMAGDEEIITLRSAVRKAAESKLSHGIIDVNDLVREINAENAARVQQSIHEIEMLKEMYDLIFTRNFDIAK
ncbi:MAG: TolC family protein [Prevotella sp.]|nr:TolC family protein [Prevotella sp.]